MFVFVVRTYKFHDDGQPFASIQDGHLHDELGNVFASVFTIFIVQCHSDGDAPVIDACLLRGEDERHGAVDTRTWIPARALLQVLQVDLQQVLPRLHEGGNIHSEGIVTVCPVTCLLTIDANRRLGHRTVEEQLGMTAESRRNVERALVVPLANPRQGTRASALLRGLRLAVLLDGHFLQIPFLVERPADCPVVGHAHRLPRLLIA